MEWLAIFCGHFCKLNLEVTVTLESHSAHLAIKLECGFMQIKCLVNNLENHFAQVEIKFKCHPKLYYRSQTVIVVNILADEIKHLWQQHHQKTRG